MRKPLKTYKITLFILSIFLTLVVVYVANELMFAAGTHALCVPILTPLRVIIICVLVGYFYTTQERPLLFGMLIGAATYLLIEDSVLGCVRDYFNFVGLFKFNISDVLITLSSVGIVASGLKISATKFKN